MIVSVAQIIGLSGLPKSPQGLRKWIRANSVPHQRTGATIKIGVGDLPSDIRRAFYARECEHWDLPLGTFDDAAQMALLAATAKARARAEHRARIATLLVGGRARGLRETELFELAREKFGSKGTSTATLKRILKAVKGVDPINFVPALLDDYKPAPERALMTDEAWQFFLTLISNGAPEFPLRSAWRDTRDVGASIGWDVPSFPTFFRRWQGLSEAQRLVARHGKEEATKRLTQPVHRDKTSINPLEWVSLDGRTLDLWADLGDGRAVRPTIMVLVDVASNMILGWELAESENARATVRLIKDTCTRHGIFDRLYTDNGSAFSGHLVAGGADFKFRNARRAKGPQPFGICKFLGIELKFALPGNAQAKIAERIFATLSRVVDDLPEFRKAHAGRAPGASPSKDVTPVPIDQVRKVYGREIERHNAKRGRRGQGANGRSYAEIFADGRAQRTARKATKRQLYLAGLIWKPVSVDRNGQVQIDGWVYGGPDTQRALLRHNGTGQKILLGRDPDDFSAPAMAYDEGGNLIAAEVDARRAVASRFTWDRGQR